tara:strand:- start:296 stop:1690 length:1395 start_codon:yes stop_codon:yes gene_type:complete
MRKRFKFARGAIWLFLVLSILLLGYTYYRAEIVYQGGYPEKYFQYYVISLTGILFWGVILRLKDEIKLNIAMVTTSLVVGVYLVEITLNFTDHAGWGKFAAHTAVTKIDARNKFQVYQDLKSEGVDATLSLRPAMFRSIKGVPGIEPLFPLGGLSGKVTVVKNETGKFMIYLSDRYGFNNPDLEWDASQTEWVLAGDSMAQGFAVQQGEDIAGQIRSKTGENVITLGMGGNGPLTELATLKEYAESRKPETVLWLYYESNDLAELIEEKPVPLLTSYLQPQFSQNLMHRQEEIDERLLEYFFERIKSKSEKLFFTGEPQEMAEYLWMTRILRLYNIRRRLESQSPKQHEAVMPLFTEILKKARDRVAAWGGKLYFVYVPSWLRYRDDVLYHDPSHIKRVEVIGVVKDLNLPVIDIHQEVFANHPDPLSLFPFRAHAHYTPEGFSEVAKAIILGVRNAQRRPSQE